MYGGRSRLIDSWTSVILGFIRDSYCDSVRTSFLHAEVEVASVFPMFVLENLPNSGLLNLTTHPTFLFSHLEIWIQFIFPPLLSDDWKSVQHPEILTAFYFPGPIQEAACPRVEVVVLDF